MICICASYHYFDCYHEFISIASTSDDRPPHHFLLRRCCHPSRRYNAPRPLLALQRPHRHADTSYDRTRPTRTRSEFCPQVAALLPRHSAQGCRDRREKCCAEKNGAPGCKREGAHSSHYFNDPIKPAHTTSHRTCATTGHFLYLFNEWMQHSHYASF